MAKDVASDYSAAMEMIKRSGQQGVPVVATPDEVIVGFDQAALARVAKKYSTPKRPPFGVLATDAAEYLDRHPEAAEGVPAGTKGVFVGEIRPGSVAERAGLRRADIITSLAGKRANTMSALDRLIDTLKPGDEVTVKFLRGGVEESAKLHF
ncbi:MAG: PDZ domain-containing protein [Chloroflexota bacterium]|nr:PDZ domain-containing protein [Chloroflexota bacterium]